MQATRMGVNPGGDGGISPHLLEWGGCSIQSYPHFVNIRCLHGVSSDYFLNTIYTIVAFVIDIYLCPIKISKLDFCYIRHHIIYG